MDGGTFFEMPSPLAPSASVDSDTTFDLVFGRMPRRRVAAERVREVALSTATFALEAFCPRRELRASPADVAAAVGYLYMRGMVASARGWGLLDDAGDARALGEAMTWCESAPPSPLTRFARYWHEGWVTLSEDVEASSSGRPEMLPLLAEGRAANAARFFTLALQAFGEVVDGGEKAVVEHAIGAFDLLSEDARG